MIASLNLARTSRFPLLKARFAGSGMPAGSSFVYLKAFGYELFILAGTAFIDGAISLC